MNIIKYILHIIKGLITLIPKWVRKFIDSVPQRERGKVVGSGSTKGLTRQDLQDQMEEHFVDAVKSSSTRKGILFPVSFYIFMYPNDYENLMGSFKRDFEEAVEIFYCHINHLEKKGTAYKGPLSPYWYFKFAKISKDQEIPGLQQIEEGKVRILSEIRTEGLTESDNVCNANEVRGTLREKGGKLFDENEIRSKIEDVPGGFKLKYSEDDRKKESLSNEAYSTDKEIYAELTFIGDNKFIRRDGSKGTKYSMKDQLIYISGNNPEYSESGSYDAIVDSSDVKNRHVRIKYFPKDDKFQIFAEKEDVRINGKKITHDDNWKDLSDESRIFISGKVSIVFKKIKK